MLAFFTGFVKLLICYRVVQLAAERMPGAELTLAHNTVAFTILMSSLGLCTKKMMVSRGVNHLRDRYVPIILSVGRTNLSDCIHSFRYASENRMLAVQERRWSKCDKELASVCVGSGVGHGQDASADKAQLGMQLVLESSSIDRSTTRTRSCRIATLNHEAIDDPVKENTVVESLFGKLVEIGTRLWCMSPVQLDGQSAHGSV